MAPTYLRLRELLHKRKFRYREQEHWVELPFCDQIFFEKGRSLSRIPVTANILLQKITDNGFGLNQNV